MWFFGLITRSYSGGAEEAWMKGWRERAADIFTKHGEIAVKMKPASEPLGFGTSDSPHRFHRLVPRGVLPARGASPHSGADGRAMRDQIWQFFRRHSRIVMPVTRLK